MAEVDIQTVYFVAKDMARLEDFYGSALGIPVQFRDENKWTQFRLQRSAFALSSAEEAAQGAVGAVPVFQIAGEAQDEVRQKTASSPPTRIQKRTSSRSSENLRLVKSEAHSFAPYWRINEIRYI